MNLTRRFTRPVAALSMAAAALITTTGIASAAPGDLAPTDAPFSVIDTAALPLNDTARWATVLGHDSSSETLRGITICSINHVPAPVDLDPRSRAATPTFTAQLRPTGDPRGWAATVSAAGYPDVNAASYALASYRRYLDACRTAPETAAPYVNGAVGTSVLDPTEAHALIETHDAWMEVFAVATNDALVETVFTRPKGGPIEFTYNPAAVFGALKMADVGALARPAANPL